MVKVYILSVYTRLILKRISSLTILVTLYLIIQRQTKPEFHKEDPNWEPKFRQADETVSVRIQQLWGATITDWAFDIDVHS